MNQNFCFYRLSFALIIVFQSFALYGQNSFSLSGEWKFRIDSTNIGEKQNYQTTSLNETVQLPGSMNLNGKGYEIGVNTKWTGSMWNKDWYNSDFYAPYRTKENLKIVFWLSPNKVYTSAAWYNKEIEIPQKWSDKAIVISLERCHWVSSIWLDGKKIGDRNSLSVPHKYTLIGIRPGKHKLSIQVDNSVKDINPGVDAHSISDNTQTNWNGVIGEMKMEAHPLILLSNVKIFPSAKNKQIRAEVKISNFSKQTISSQLLFGCNSLSLACKKNILYNILPGDTTIVVEIPISGSIKLWDEFSPNLYTLKTKLVSDIGTDLTATQFGFRELGTKGTQITINNRPVFFRGTLECCVFPKTGFPPTDYKAWEREFKIAKAHGLNHIRFHSWCPPKAAFDAADKLGVYLQVECDAWAEIGEGKPIDEYVIAESKRIVDEYGNHPSFCLFLYGNEPAGKHHTEYLTKFVQYWKNRDNRFYYTSGAGWPAIDLNDYHCLPAPRIQSWGAGNKSIINSATPSSNFDWSNKISKTIPTISHEIGQWCVYPNLKERSKYDGLLKAENFDIFEDRLRNSNLLQLADSFLLSSGKLQTLCYKADIEAALRTPDFGGFQLLGLTDFPGQGSAIVGVLDPFWDEKSYVSAKEFAQFCNQTVPLAILNKFIYTSGEELLADVKVAHFGLDSLNKPTVKWTIKQADGKVVYSQKLAINSIPTGTLTTIGQIKQKLEVTKPVQFRLEITVNNTYTNSWDIWVYPTVDLKQSDDILVCDKADKKMWDYLSAGGKVILTPKWGTMKNEGKDSVVVGFSSIFWNTLWTNGQAPHTLGLLCNPKHPALALFPTDYYSNYQWQDIVKYTNAIQLNKFDTNLQPIVRIIDDWFKARSIALAVELKVGNGKLMLVGSDLLLEADKRPGASQLLVSFKEYMKSSTFNPQIEVNKEVIQSLLK